MRSYYEDDFLPLWNKKLEEFNILCQEHDLDLDKIAWSYSREIKSILRTFKRGNPLSQIKKELKRVIEELKKTVDDRIDEEQQHLRLLSVYDEHSDLASYFPLARSMSRRIFFFCGPTNSGKTYAALEELAKSKSGVYLAPLRLLALEVQQTLLAKEVSTSMITGEEQDVVEGSKFTSSTIEMLNYDEAVETAVIDEIQLIADKQRGWAWTNALLGVPAKQIILTGSPNAIPLVEELAEYLGEPLEVRHFERFHPLHINETWHKSLKKIKLDAGTAIICFSRRDVLSIKGELEQNKRYKVSVIYGGLSPEVRRTEAQRFRDKETDILVATDAVGMGLNLPIKDILFWETTKFYNREDHPLTPSEIQQIAGRAGRFGLKEEGYAGAFSKKDLKAVANALSRELPLLKGPCLVQPLRFHLDMLSQILKTQELVQILRFFKQKLWFSNDIFRPNITEDLLALARALEPILGEESLIDKYTFASAPVPMRAAQVVQAHSHFALGFASSHSVLFLKTLGFSKFRGIAKDVDELYRAENAVQIATLYQWLAYRYPEVFIDVEKARNSRIAANDYISRSLREGNLARRCKSCHKKLALNSRHTRCDACYHTSFEHPWM